MPFLEKLEPLDVDLNSGKDIHRQSLIRCMLEKRVSFFLDTNVLLEKQIPGPRIIRNVCRGKSWQTGTDAELLFYHNILYKLHCEYVDIINMSAEEDDVFEQYSTVSTIKTNSSTSALSVVSSSASIGNSCSDDIKSEVAEILHELCSDVEIIVQVWNAANVVEPQPATIVKEQPLFELDAQPLTMIDRVDAAFIKLNSKLQPKLRMLSLVELSFFMLAVLMNNPKATFDLGCVLFLQLGIAVSLYG